MNKHTFFYYSTSQTFHSSSPQITKRAEQPPFLLLSTSSLNYYKPSSFFLSNAKHSLTSYFFSYHSISASLLTQTILSFLQISTQAEIILFQHLSVTIIPSFTLSTIASQSSQTFHRSPLLKQRNKRPKHTCLDTEQYETRTFVLLYLTSLDRSYFSPQVYFPPVIDWAGYRVAGRLPLLVRAGGKSP